MRILGLDIATNTGWAFSSGRDGADIVSGSFKCSGDDPFSKSSSLEDHLHSLIKEHGRPEFAVIEAPLPAGPNPSVLASLNMMFGAGKAVIRGYKIPAMAVPDSTWRNKMYGFGRKRGWKTSDWKKHAKFHCNEILKLDVRSPDEAEAIMISQYGFYTQTFRNMVREAEAA